MIKKKILFIFIGLLSFLTMYHVYALTIDNPYKLVNVTATGETGHGAYNLTINPVNPDDVTADQDVQKSNYIARIELSTDPGYYVEEFSVKLNDQDLALGFIAGAEQGAFFRRYDFNYTENLYEFFIPETTTEDNKVEVSIKYSEKDSVNIYYQKYNGTDYQNGIYEVNNYGEENLLVENYRDGDLVLTPDAISNGCLLKLQFSEESYALFKGHNESDEIRAEAVIENEGRFDNVLDTGRDACDDEGHFCYVLVSKDFNQLSQGDLRFGYNNIKVYVPNYVGFKAQGDVNNFNDSRAHLGFNNNSLEQNLEELFYGTKTLSLIKTVPKAIINEGTNNCGQAGDFDAVTGSGYGYTTSYNNGVVTVNLNSYYQDKMQLNLTLTKNNQNIFDGPVKINLNRFAFNGQLMEVDSIGRNCQEANNGNTCAQGRYYSAEYRGVLSAFYVADDVEEENIDSLMVVDSIDGNNINLSEWNQPERAYRRNKDFNPHVLALFYDQNDMIVETKTFDLNNDISDEGYQSKASFEYTYANYNLNREITKNFIMFGNNARIPIKNIDYFKNIDNAAIMHQIVLMGKDEVEEKGVEKIALFLINGEIEEDEIPSLTYGVGEGKIFQVRHDNGGND